MTDDQRKAFCRMYFALYLSPFRTDRAGNHVLPSLRNPEMEKILQQVIDEMEDRAYAHYTTGEFRRHGAKVRAMPPRPRWLTAEWLEYREFAAYDPGHLWNGWACPLVTRAQLEALLPEHNASSGIALEDPYLELREDGVLISRYLDEEEVGESLIHPARADGISEPLYDIGSIGLCWEWGEEEMELCPCGSAEFEEVQMLTSTASACVKCGKVKR